MWRSHCHSWCFLFFFTVKLSKISELLRENQQGEGVKLLPPSPPRLWLRSNFLAEVIHWTILQLCLNENVWNYYIHQKGMRNVLDWQSIKKKLIHLKYLILEGPYIFFLIFSCCFSFTYTDHSITCVFRC